MNITNIDTTGSSPPPSPAADCFVMAGQARASGVSVRGRPSLLLLDVGKRGDDSLHLPYIFEHLRPIAQTRGQR